MANVQKMTVTRGATRAARRFISREEKNVIRDARHRAERRELRGRLTRAVTEFYLTGDWDFDPSPSAARVTELDII